MKRLRARHGTESGTDEQKKRHIDAEAAAEKMKSIEKELKVDKKEIVDGEKGKKE